MTENTDINDKLAVAGGVWAWIRFRFCTREMSVLDGARLLGGRGAKPEPQTALDPPKPTTPPPKRRRHAQATTFLELP